MQLRDPQKIVAVVVGVVRQAREGSSVVHCPGSKLGTEPLGVFAAVGVGPGYGCVGIVPGRGGAGPADAALEVRGTCTVTGDRVATFPTALSSGHAGTAARRGGARGCSAATNVR